MSTRGRLAGTAIGYRPLSLDKVGLDCLSPLRLDQAMQALPTTQAGGTTIPFPRTRGS